MSGAKRIANAVVRVAATGAHLVVRAWWFVRRPRTFGAHAIALTPQGRIVLVKLRYARGWRVPGGGRAEGEDTTAAALRELREEIGMISHGEARPVRDFDERTHFKHDTASLVIVRDVVYRPARWNWEVEDVCEADPAALPRNMSAGDAHWIESIRSLL